MTIQHKDIPDAQRHEPKGASTANAGDVYISDGLGSGSWGTPPVTGQASASEGMILKSLGSGNVAWKYLPSGWGYYRDSLAGSQLINTTYAKLLNDGSGTTTNEDYLPYEIRGTSSLWDTVNSKITPISVGDSYDVRLDIPVTGETGSPTEMTLALDIGTGTSPSTVIVTKYESTGKATPYILTFTFPIFCLNTFVSNGGQLFAKTDTGSLTIGDIGILITRTSAGDF